MRGHNLCTICRKNGELIVPVIQRGKWKLCKNHMDRFFDGDKFYVYNGRKMVHVGTIKFVDTTGEYFDDRYAYAYYAVSEHCDNFGFWEGDYNSADYRSVTSVKCRIRQDAIWQFLNNFWIDEDWYKTPKDEF